MEVLEEDAMQPGYGRSSCHHFAVPQWDHSMRWEDMLRGMRPERQMLGCPEDEAGFVLVVCSPFEQALGL